MNRRSFLKMAASAAAGLVVPRVDPAPKYTDADVERIVEENESLQLSLASIRIGTNKTYGILTDIACRLKAHGFPWAIWWRDLADQVESLCIERDELKGRVEMYEDTPPPYVRIGDASDLEDIPGITPSVDIRSSLDDLPPLRGPWSMSGGMPIADGKWHHASEFCYNTDGLTWFHYAAHEVKGENDAKETDPV